MQIRRHKRFWLLYKARLYVPEVNESVAAHLATQLYISEKVLTYTSLWWGVRTLDM